MLRSNIRPRLRIVEGPAIDTAGNSRSSCGRYDGRYYPPPRSAAFRVRWQGYGAKDDTWERAGGLPDDLKLEFWRDLQNGIRKEPAR